MEGYEFFSSKVIISNAYSDNHISLVIFPVTPQKNIIGLRKMYNVFILNKVPNLFFNCVKFLQNKEKDDRQL